MNSAMGSRAAYAEAVRRWGHSAMIQIAHGQCHVGTVGILWDRIRGSGKTWSLAFADSDKRAGIQPAERPEPLP